MLFGLGTCKRDNNYSFVKLFDYNNVAKDSIYNRLLLNIL